MKVRQWFVSNSSSSSFVICYKVDDKDHWVETLKNRADEMKEEYRYYCDGGEDNEFIIVDDVKLLIHDYELLKQYKTDLHNGYMANILEVNSEDDLEISVTKCLDVLNCNGYNIKYDWEGY